MKDASNTSYFHLNLDYINRETEKQLWEVIRIVPGLNVTYGTVRCMVYVIKKDEKESISSAVGVAKGAIQTASITAGALAAPVTIPVGFGALTGIAAKSATETVEIVVFFLTNSDGLQGKSPTEKEKIFYEKIRHVIGVGALYSAIRVPIYIFSRNKERSIESAVNFVADSGDTAVKVGVSMIPDVDAHLQKIITQTVRHVIKHCEAKVLNQIPGQNTALMSHPQVIAELETIEIDPSMPSINVDDDAKSHETGNGKNWCKLLCCCCST